MENFRLEWISPTVAMVFILDEVAPAWRPAPDTGERQVCWWLDCGCEVWFCCISGSHWLQEAENWLVWVCHWDIHLQLAGCLAHGWAVTRQAGLRVTLGDNLTQNRAGRMEDETETSRRRHRVNYQSISLFHVFNLRLGFIISDSMWCFLKVILTIVIL